MKKTTLLVLFAIALMAVSATASRAATIVYAADFNGAGNHTGNFTTSADYANGGLIGQDAWVNHSGLATNPQTVAGAPANGSVALTTSGEDNHANFTPAATAGSVYLSADINVSAAQATGDYFLHLSDGGTSNFNDRVFAKSSGNGFVMALGTSSGATPTYGATVLNFGQTYHIVAEYDIVAGLANDTGALYVDPTDPVIGGDNLYVAATLQGVDAVSLSAADLRQGSAANAPTVVVDNVLVAVQVPEPASFGLLLVGSAMGLLFVRRRKAA